MILQDKKVAITGGTGSLGKNLVHGIMSGKYGKPRQLIIFSRDEDKQYAMELDWRHLQTATDDIFYSDPDILGFRIGDVRDYESVIRLVRESEIIIHAAALKQVPLGEYFPYESVKTNILGTQNLIRAVMEFGGHVDTVLVVSTDKAAKPVNTYGMCKAIQERLIIEANRLVPTTRFIAVRYGNVVASRGSIIPLFKEQIRKGGPITITTPEMTRFMLTLEMANEVIFDALSMADAGDIFVPDIPTARIVDLAEVMIGNRDIDIKYIGMRPGEKHHEILISEEEIPRTVKKGDYYVICPILPQLRKTRIGEPVMEGELSSEVNPLTRAQLEEFLRAGDFLDI